MMEAMLQKKKTIPFYKYNNVSIADVKNGIENLESIYFPRKEICPYCNSNIKERRAIMCRECRNKEMAKNIPTKEELEKLIYIESFVTIGKKYGVTDNAARRWCKKYGLPYKSKELHSKAQ